ncbi:MAG TPA: 4Fe-4S binding protein [Candidatus Cloacimonadota bacterium]|nr:4Fe-4S binding protein [Candidatus Cloacimonadota bacterium]
MKQLILIVTALLLLVGSLQALSLKDHGDHTGIIRQTSHSVYLDKEDGSYLLLLTAGVIRDSVWVPVPGDSAVVKAYQFPGQKILEVLQITDASGVTLIRDSQYQPLHQAQSILTVDPGTCIGCRLCERNCPVDAISMVGRIAVIDQSKCVECGVCIDGNGRFRGCPVGSIKNTEE